MPLHIKQGSQYEAYVTQLADSLKDFFQRTKPLVDFREIVEQTEEMFEAEWEQRSLFGWESAIAKLYGEAAAVQPVEVQRPTGEGEAPESGQEKKQALYCELCRKSFIENNVFEHHKKGKRHIKAVEEYERRKAA